MEGDLKISVPDLCPVGLSYFFVLFNGAETHKVSFFSIFEILKDKDGTHSAMVPICQRITAYSSVR